MSCDGADLPTALKPSDVAHAARPILQKVIHRMAAAARHRNPKAGKRHIMRQKELPSAVLELPGVVLPLFCPVAVSRCMIP